MSKSALLPVAAGAALLFALPASARGRNSSEWAEPLADLSGIAPALGATTPEGSYFDPVEGAYVPVDSPQAPAYTGGGPERDYNPSPVPDSVSLWDYMGPDIQGVGESSMPQPENSVTPVDNSAANLVAMLALIRTAESRDDYTALVGGGNFSSFTDHPYATGEFKGWRRKDGRLSTAAGAYQITVTTWRDIGGVKRFGNFSPAAQDEAAIFLIKRRKAYDDVLAGRFGVAIYKLRNEWEFIVTPQWPDTKLAQVYQQNGGIIV